MATTDAGKRAGASKARRAADLPTERKYVTVLRTDIVRSTDLLAGLDLEEALARLKPVLDLMYAAIREHGGVVWKEMGDGVFAVFGAPLANDRHAVVACHAAIDLMDRIAAQPDAAFKIRIGLHSGFVVAGVQRSEWNAGYEVAGPALHLADRLQSAAAPGQIIVSNETRTLAKESIAFEPAGRQTLKGFPEPVPLYRVAGILPSAGSKRSGQALSEHFLGRSKERALIAAAADAARAGSGSLIAVVGEAGVGKSRLVQAAFGPLAGAGWANVTVDCNTIMGNSPFAVVRELTATLLRLPALATLDASRLLLPAEHAAINVLLSRPHAAEVWAGLGQRARERALTDAVQSLVKAAGRESPTLIVIEDVQWCDDASAPIIEALAEAVAAQPVLLAFTARADGLPGWARDRASVRIMLQPLDNADAAALIDHILGTDAGLADLKERILQHTGRLPLFIKEVCLRIAEMGTIKGQAGQFRAATMHPALDVPSTVHGVIAARVDRLAAQEKQLLQTASVIGPKGPVKLLKSIARLSPRAFATCLKSLETAELLLPDRSGRANAFLFPHDLVRQVTNSALLDTERTDLHSRVLADLEAGETQGIDDLQGALVHHAEMARHWASAAGHAERVAQNCMEQGAIAEANHYFERAIKAVDRLEASPSREQRAIDLRLECRSTAGNVGQLSRVLELVTEAEARARQLGDEVRLMSVMISRVSALNFVGPISEAVSIGQAIMRRAAEMEDAAWLAKAEYNLGQAAYQAGDYRFACSLLTSAQGRLSNNRAGSLRGIAATHLLVISTFMLSLCWLALGDDDGVAKQHAMLAETAQRNKRPLYSFAATFGAGVLSLSQADAPEAERLFKEALELATQNDLFLFVPLSWFHLGLALFRQDRMSDASHAFAEAKASATDVGVFAVRLRSDLYLQLTRAAHDRLDQVLAEVGRIRDTARQQGYMGILAEGHAIQGAVLLRCADDESGSAGAHLKEAIRLSSDLSAVTLQRWTAGFAVPA